MNAFGSELRAAAADDLAMLVRLHDDPSPAVIDALATIAPAEWLQLPLRTARADDGRALLADALTAWTGPVPQDASDEIAVDHANIYLLFTYRAAPTESPWRDPEGLERQSPMFDVAAWYRRHGLCAEDRQKRPDDHLVIELQFLAWLIDPATGPASPAEAAEFLDRHLLAWVPQFAERVAMRCATPYFAGIALLTAAYLDELRDRLAEHAGLPRPVAPIADGTKAIEQACGVETAPRYVPGAAPSW
ncbi:MAG: molecular chaperone TorD family protein [Pseudomonadota bacterium]